MTRIFTEGFEMGDVLGFDTVSGGVVSTEERSGVYCGERGCSGAGHFIKTLPSSYTELYVRAAIQMTNLGVGSIYIDLTDSVSTNDLFRLRLQHNNNPTVYIGGVSIGVCSNLFVATVVTWDL